MRDPADGFFTLMGRGLRKRCPRCGSGGIFTSRYRIRSWCPACGLRFEREEGYWVGAMIINMMVTVVALAAVIGAGIALSWPDVPWTTLTAVAVASAALTPVLFYPRSLTTWLATELSFHALEPEEREEAAARAAGITGRPD